MAFQSSFLDWDTIWTLRAAATEWLEQNPNNPNAPEVTKARDKAREVLLNGK